MKNYKDADVRYGKPSFDVAAIKPTFSSQNEQALNEARRSNELYSQQPIRTNCKICGTKLCSLSDFASHGIEYYFCPNCEHVNGKYQDTLEFVKSIYTGAGYASGYFVASSQDYFSKVDAIYSPKARFLLNSLQKAGVAYDSLSFLDIGAGSGYMAAALDRYGLKISGIEASEEAVTYANAILEKRILEPVRPEQLTEKLKATSADIIMFIGVLEHLHDLESTFSAIKGNPAIKYLFFSVPLFSFTVILESIFPDVFNRHLGGEHTHLFTQKSLQWVFERYGFEKMSCWEFGTDSMDLFRSLLVKVSHNKFSQKIHDYIYKISNYSCDEFQSSLDRGGFASETHILAKVNAG